MKKKLLIATMSLVMGSALIAALPKMGIDDGKSDNVIELSQCIPLSDIAEAYLGNDGYYHVVLKDVSRQLDDPENLEYAELLENFEMMEGK